MVLIEPACSVLEHFVLPEHLSDFIELMQKKAFRIIFPGTHYGHTLDVASFSALKKGVEACIKLKLWRNAKKTKLSYNLEYSTPSTMPYSLSASSLP